MLNQGNAGKTCPECNVGHLAVKSGRFGNFTACSNYPNCKYIEKKTPAAGAEKPVETDEICDKCNTGHFLIRTGQFGKFKACSNFPKCKNTKKFSSAE
ncbi:MAG: topoisomerase DNA-binding C4 zinc finger domain-containing protein [Candidatus Pacebacteria bacterium]|nr:topoisomerase DNA-binding C4 zinc finger domain-containing protein [Candidatus Paceibacterota bacterium]